MPWIDDESYDDKSLGGKGTLTAITVDRSERLDRYNKLQGTGLCFRCSHAFIMRTKRMNEPVVRCENQTGEPHMPLDIVECNRYREVGKLSLSEMATLAKMVGEPEKRQAGFLGRYSISDQGPLADGTEQESLP